MRVPPPPATPASATPASATPAPAALATAAGRLRRSCAEGSPAVRGPAAGGAFRGDTAPGPVADLTRLPHSTLDRLDDRISRSMRRYGVRLLRYAIGVVFIWFGALKLVPGLSPAEDLVRATVPFGADWFVPVLAVWEVLIGVLLLVRPAVRGALFLLALQMPGTFLPFVVLPAVCFSVWPLASPLDVFALTLEGQYIVKNVVLVAAGLVVGGTVRRPSSPEQRL